MGDSTSRQASGGRLWFAAAALLALPLCIDATGDPDLWWHLRLGQWIADHGAVPHTELFSYTAAGAPQVDHEWLAELLFWWVHGAIGLAGLAVAVGLVTCSGLLALGWIARRHGASGFSIGLVLLLGAKAMQPVTGTRPQMFTFALLCWSLLILDRHLRRGGRAVWLLVPVFLLWANLHAGFVVGLGLLAVVIAAWLVDAAAGHRLDAQAWRRALSGGAALAVCAAVALLNPNGSDLYRFALLGSAPAAHQLIQEWQRPDFTSASMLPLALLIVATAAAMVIGRRRLRPSQVILAVLAVAAALLAVRNIALAVALVSPALAELLPLRYRLPARPLLLPAAAIAAAAAVLVTVVVRTATDTAAAALARQWPACLVTDLQSGTAPVRLWLPYGEAGRAIDQAWPQVTVYAYGNDAALGPSTITDYVRVAAGATTDPAALSLLTGAGTTAVITAPGALADQLAAAGWHRVTQAPTGEILFAAPATTPPVAGPCPG